MPEAESSDSLKRYKMKVAEYAKQVIEIEDECKRMDSGNYQGVTSWPDKQQEWRKSSLANLKMLANAAGIPPKEHLTFLHEAYDARKK